MDVGRYGPDPTTYAFVQGNTLIRLESKPRTSIPEVARDVAGYIKRYGLDPSNVAIDTVGLGGGVWDILTEAGYRCQSIVSGAAPLEEVFAATEESHGFLSSFRYRDLRAQMWWNLRVALEGQGLAIALEEGPERQRLLEDLVAPKYAIDKDKTIKVESKKDIKKRLGRSTDEGDAVVYALFADKMPRAASWLVHDEDDY